MTLHRSTLGALAGIALAGLLAACAGGSASTAYTPLTAQSTPAPASAPATTDPAPAQAPAQVAPVSSAPAATSVAPQAPATDFTALARRFVALRNQGTQTLAAIKGQASSTDLNVDKQLMATAANVYRNYASELGALPFPATMRNDALALVQVVTTLQSTFAQASQVATFNDLNPLLQKLVDSEDDQLNATDALEKDLGLPQSTPSP